MDGRRKWKLNRDRVHDIVERLALCAVKDSAFVYGGDCPICGGVRSFVLWLKTGEMRCSKCGLVAHFGPAPEADAKSK